MEDKKQISKKDVEIKGYSANAMANTRNNQQTTDGYNAVQSSEIRKGYNPQMSTQNRNEQPFKEGYNAQQMVQTANTSQPIQQDNSSKKSENKK